MKPLTKRQSALAEKNIKLPLKMARSMAGNFPHLEQDLKSASQWGLVKAAGSFNRRKCVKFSTFAHECILNEMLRVITKSYPLGFRYLGAKGKARVVSVGSIVDSRPTSCRTRGSHEEEVDSVDLANHAISCLEPHRRRRVLKYYGDDMSMDEIAASEGVSRSAIQQNLERSVKAMRKQLGVETP